MAAGLRSIILRTWRTLASIETGVVLLILVVILSALGTIILQRPATKPEEMQSAYAPQVLRILDTVGLTDLFHSWWFLGLVFLVSVCIVAASLNRLPNRWKYYSNPYQDPDESFRRNLHPQRSLALPSGEPGAEGSAESGLRAAEHALQSRGYKPERVLRRDYTGVFAERYRISELAVYFVHASLLLIFFGTIIDGLWGWRGTVTLDEGQSTNVVETQEGRSLTLPFFIRCDSTGQENYSDGTPKKWWSKLAVVKAGRDVREKEIVVNDPLVYDGIRFFQSSYVTTGTVDKIKLVAARPDGSGQEREFGLAVSDVASIDPDTAVRLVGLIPGNPAGNGQESRSSGEQQKPAVHLAVTTKKDGKTFDVWLPHLNEAAEDPGLLWRFHVTEMRFSQRTRLEVSHEPGQWLVWSGAVLMGVGLAFAFYLVHVRFWVVPVRDAVNGKLSLWIGGSANRNREGFEERFDDLVNSIESELAHITRPGVSEQIATIAEKSRG